MAGRTEPSSVRRSARVNIRIPVTISGTSADNKVFQEDTFAVTLSKFGAKIKTNIPMKEGMQLKLKPKGRKDTALFRVAWIGREGTPREGEVGIEYVKVSNLLGVAFPD